MGPIGDPDWNPGVNWGPPGQVKKLCHRALRNPTRSLGKWPTGATHTATAAMRCQWDAVALELT